MAINDAVAAYTGQQSAAAAEYKDAWSDAPSAGVGQFGSRIGRFGSRAGQFGSRIGQFGSRGPFSNAAAGLSSTPGSDVGALTTAASQAVQPPSTAAPVMIDALPTTPVGATSSDPIPDVAATIGNYTAEKPYVSGVTDAGAVGRQEARPERLVIDETMTADEQYRRAWQNEANGYYGNDIDKVAPPPAAPAPAPAPTPTPAPAPAAPAHSMSDDDRALLDLILRERRAAEYSNRFA